MTGALTAGAPPAAAEQPAGPRKPLPYSPSEREKKLIKRVEERITFTTRESPRWALDRQMFETISFSIGCQWLTYDSGSARLTQWKAPAWFPTPVQNELGPLTDAMTARVLRAEPRTRVRPGSNDPGDQEGARVAEKLLVHFDDVTFESEKRQEAAHYGVLTGTAIFEDYWDPQAGQMLAVPRVAPQLVDLKDPASVCPACGYQGGIEEVSTTVLCPQCSGALEPGERPRMLSDGVTPAKDMQMVPETDPETGEPIVDYFPEGEIATRVRMLFNFYWDPKATTLREARWCGEAQYADIDWIDQNFPEMGKHVAEEGSVDVQNFYEAALLGLVGPSIQGTAHGGGSGYYQHGAVVRRLQEKPSQEYPKGIYAIVANGVLLYPRPDPQTGAIECALPIKDKNGIPTGDFTYTEWKYGFVPGRFPGRTPADDMVPLQRQVNGIGAQKILNRKTFINPWLLAPKGSGFVAGQTALQPGATLLYNSIGTGATPQIVPGTALPDDVNKEKQDCIEAMGRLAQDVQLGQTDSPDQMKSGITVNFIREQKDEVAVPRMKRWATCMQERGRKRLLLAGQHYREKRAIRVIGEGSDWEVQYWAGADLHGQTDVIVDPASIVPRSKAAKDQLMLDAVEAGLIDLADPMQKQKVIEALDLFEFETEIAPDQRRARMENAKMSLGIQVARNPWDNDAVHAYEVLRQIKDPSFDTKPPEVQQLFVMHWQEHDMVLQAQAAAEQAQQMALAAQGQNGKGKGNGKAPPLDTSGAGAEAHAVAA